ncbi:Solute carrier family 22 member 15 [Portunus trituberculatus]|uniref:Solute carrier family 22 member 15 n=1 Tax=Portunus trituberculatus TaxID=210409 RepID=A0A5B7JC33_PORTR|nr:Solute carrier family 22 member 15 [Portunus trituberculatus]
MPAFVCSSAYATTILTLAMLGKVAITGGFQTIAFFASELFPTEVRSRGISTSYMMSRIGAMVSPFITDLVVSCCCFRHWCLLFRIAFSPFSTGTLFFTLRFVYD